MYAKKKKRVAGSTTNTSILSDCINNDTNFNVRLDIAMATTGKTPKELAEMMGIKQSRMYQILRGESPLFEKYLILYEFVEKHAPMAGRESMIRELATEFYNIVNPKKKEDV